MVGNGKLKLIVVAIIIIAIIGGLVFYFSSNKKTADNNSETVENNSEKQEIVKKELEIYLKEMFGEDIEEVKFNDIRILPKSEIENNEVFNDYNLGENDFVFESGYELKIKDGVTYDEMMRYTAATGEIDGQWIKEKYNCGVIRVSENGNYSITNFGTGY